MLQTVMREDIQPWYRQLWPWLLISLPASAVFGGIATIIIAVNSPNALVADDYYKQGLAINLQTRRLQAAAAQGLEGLVRGSRDSGLQLQLQGGQPVYPDKLKLEFIHATRDDFDRQVVLSHQGNGRYSAAYPDLPAGNWYLRLRAQESGWELRARSFIDDGMQVRLSGLE